MVYLSLTKWPDIAQLSHEKTTWIIAKTKRNDELLDEVHRADKTDHLTTYVANVDVPKGATYYARAIRHFKDSDQDMVSNIIEVINTETGYDALLLEDDIRIDKPMLRIISTESDHAIGKLIIKSSRFRANKDKHKCTHWIIVNAFGNVEYVSINDTKNLTELTVSNINVTSNDLTVYCIHAGQVGLESPVGEIKIINKTTYPFELITSLSNVKQFEDLRIVFMPLNKADTLAISGVSLLDYNTNEVLHTLELGTDKKSYTLPWYYLKEMSKYKIKVNCVDINGNYAELIKPLDVEQYNNLTIRNSSFEPVVALAEGTTKEGIVIPNNLAIESMFNGYILIPNKKDMNMDIMVMKDDLLENANKKAAGITLTSRNIDYTLVRPLSKGMIIIDSYNSNNKPTFSIYTYSNNYDKFTLLHTKIRNDETAPMGKTNNFIRVRSDYFIYIPVGTRKLRKYDIVKNTIEDLGEIPYFEKKYDRLIMILAKNNLLHIGNGEDYKSVTYNYENKTWKDGYVFGPNSFITKFVRPIQLINGNTLYYRNPEVNRKDDNGDICYSYFKDLKTEDLKLTFNSVKPSSYIMHNSGIVYFTHTETLSDGTEAGFSNIGIFGSSTDLSGYEDIEIGKEVNYSIHLVGATYSLTGLDLEVLEQSEFEGVDKLNNTLYFGMMKNQKTWTSKYRKYNLKIDKPDIAKIAIYNTKTKKWEYKDTHTVTLPQSQTYGRDIPFLTDQAPNIDQVVLDKDSIPESVIIYMVKPGTCNLEIEYIDTDKKKQEYTIARELVPVTGTLNTYEIEIKAGSSISGTSTTNSWVMNVVGYGQTPSSMLYVRFLKNGKPAAGRGVITAPSYAPIWLGNVSYNKPGNPDITRLNFTVPDEYLSPTGGSGWISVYINPKSAGSGGKITIDWVKVFPSTAPHLFDYIPPAQVPKSGK